MMKSGQRTIAWLLIGFGVFLLIGNFFNIEPGKIFWPLLLVAIGLILVFRPQVFRRSTFGEEANYRFAGDFTLGQDWTVQDYELRMFAGDVTIDLRHADIPDGETFIHFALFAGDIDVIVPDGVGLAAVSHGFATDAKINGQKKDHVMVGLDYKSPGYAEATKKIHFEVNWFAGSLSLSHG